MSEIGDAGMSERQRKTVRRIASVPDDEFEAAVESDAPPTVTALADRGTAGKPRGAQTHEGCNSVDEAGNSRQK